MAENKTNKELIASINELLSKTNINDVTSETNSFQELPQGYYLCSVEKAEIKESKSSGEPMVAFTFNVVENGVQFNADKDGNVESVFLGLKCKWYDKNQVLHEAIFSTKDLIHV